MGFIFYGCLGCFWGASCDAASAAEWISFGLIKVLLQDNGHGIQERGVESP